MRFQYRYSRSKPQRFHKRSRKVTFFLTQKDFYIAAFGKEMVKFYYKHIYKEKPPQFIPNKIDNVTQTSLFGLLCNTKKTAALIFVSTLFFFLPIDLFSQSNNPKTITGKIENTQGKLWNNVLVELYDSEQLLASDLTENGEFVFENIVTSVKNDEEVPTGFKLYQNYPNPFNPSTIIKFSTSPNVKSETSNTTLIVYDILGREIKTLINGQLSAGEHSVTWNGTNNNGQGVSAGVYFYRLIIGDPSTGSGQGFVQTKKMVLTDGVSSSSFNHSSIQSSNLSAVVSTKAEQSFNHLSTEGYYLRITGDSLLTTTISELPIWQDNSFFDLGTLIAPGKPIVTGFVYDLDNKYDENNNRINPIPGLEGKKVFFGSDTANFTITDSQGRFSLIADTTKTDSIFVTNTEGDSTHYNWRRTIELQPDEQVITAFNDTTGIPLFKQWVDPENGVDYFEHLIFTGAVERKFPYNPEWSQIMPRVRDQDLPIKVYLNRNNAPNEWYADSAWAGTKAMEVGRIKFTETNNPDEAIIRFRYDSIFSGQTEIPTIHTQNGWPYIGAGDIIISIKGPPGGQVHEPNVMTNVSAHEIQHFEYAGGEHSPFIQDRFYLRSEERMLAGYPLKMNEREEKGIKLIYDLERNPKLLDYSK